MVELPGPGQLLQRAVLLVPEAVVRRSKPLVLVEDPLVVLHVAGQFYVLLLNFDLGVLRALGQPFVCIAQSVELPLRGEDLGLGLLVLLCAITVVGVVPGEGLIFEGPQLGVQLAQLLLRTVTVFTEALSLSSGLPELSSKAHDTVLPVLSDSPVLLAQLPKNPLMSFLSIRRLFLQLVLKHANAL